MKKQYPLQIPQSLVIKFLKKIYSFPRISDSWGSTSKSTFSCSLKINFYQFDQRLYTFDKRNDFWEEITTKIKV